MPESTRIIFGLGNPGPRYRNTRHNIGFLIVQELAAAQSAPWSPCRYADAVEARLDDGTRLFQPQCYMNRSGEVVGRCLRWLKESPDHVLIVVDDVHLPLGQLRLRQSGSSGGHNGLKSIESYLGTDHYPRLRGGVGSPTESASLSNHVLDTFSESEMKIVTQMTQRAVQAIQRYQADGFESAASWTNTPTPL